MNNGEFVMTGNLPGTNLIGGLLFCLRRWRQRFSLLLAPPAINWLIIGPLSSLMAATHPSSCHILPSAAVVVVQQQRVAAALSIYVHRSHFFGSMVEAGGFFFYLRLILLCPAGFLMSSCSIQIPPYSSSVSVLRPQSFDSPATAAADSRNWGTHWERNICWDLIFRYLLWAVKAITHHNKLNNQPILSITYIYLVQL